MSNYNPFPDEGEEKKMFKELSRSVPTTFKVIWVGGALVSLSLTGVCVWAVIKLVTHFTGG